jgi:hypothetical protein
MNQEKQLSADCTDFYRGVMALVFSALLRQATHIAILTGAGIPAESDILTDKALV